MYNRFFNIDISNIWAMAAKTSGDNNGSSQIPMIQMYVKPDVKRGATGKNIVVSLKGNIVIKTY